LKKEHTMAQKHEAPKQAQSHASPQVLVAMGDARWEKRAHAPGETDVAIQWPEQLMQSFRVRMDAHGVPVDRLLMSCDRRYASQRLMFANSLPDRRLQKLAAELMQHLRARPVDRPAWH
jgi:ferredoxin-NADP reductase